MTQATHTPERNSGVAFSALRGVSLLLLPFLLPTHAFPRSDPSPPVSILDETPPLPGIAPSPESFGRAESNASFMPL